MSKFMTPVTFEAITSLAKDDSTIQLIKILNEINMYHQ